MDIQSGNSYIPNPSSFMDKELSCDWDRYSTPRNSLALIGKEYRSKSKVFKEPNDFFIASLLVQDILDHTTNQQIKHNPIQNIPELIGTPNNRAHSLIIGEKGDRTEQEHVKTRFWLSKISKWEIFDEARLANLIEIRKQKNQSGK
jgi:hypothetical protein